MTLLQSLDDAIVAEELARLREEHRANETASRVYEVSEQAVAARYTGFARLPVETHLRLVQRWTTCPTCMGLGCGECCNTGRP